MRSHPTFTWVKKRRERRRKQRQKVMKFIEKTNLQLHGSSFIFVMFRSPRTFYVCVCTCVLKYKLNKCLHVLFILYKFLLSLLLFRDTNHLTTASYGMMRFINVRRIQCSGCDKIIYNCKSLSMLIAWFVKSMKVL